jgi:hypothetical protein
VYACEYILVVHESRWEEFWWDGPLGDPKRFLDALWPHNRIVCNQARDCNVDQINRAALEATGTILIGTADDYFPCAYWDAVVWDAFPDKNVPAILHFSTGSPRDKELIVGGAATKAYYDEVGYILPPEFESMYADDYMTRKWREAGIVIERLDIKFEHRHPAFGSAAMDDIYALQNRPEAYAQGRAELSRREAVEFPGQPKVIACCLPGEQFSADYLAAWTGLFAHLMQRYQVHPHICHTSNVYVTRLELAQSVLDVKPHADLVLWIDDDNLVSQEQFDMLLKDLEEHPEADAVCGWCWIFNHNTNQWLTSCGRTPTDETMMYTTLSQREVMETNGLIEVRASGFPVVLMRYSMLEKLGARAFVPIVDEKLLYGFASEDAAFWKRAAAAGCRLLCDTRVRVHHLKLRAIEPVFVKAESLAYAAD